jgi:hypothetical protein
MRIFVLTLSLVLTVFYTAQADTVASLKAQFEKETGWRLNLGNVPKNNTDCLGEQLRNLKEALAGTASQIPSGIREINLEGKEGSFFSDSRSSAEDSRIQFTASIGDEDQANGSSRNRAYNNYGHLYVKYQLDSKTDCHPVSLERVRKIANDLVHRFSTPGCNSSPVGSTIDQSKLSTGIPK